MKVNGEVGNALTTEEKKILIDMRMNPRSIEGLKYAGDCRRYKIKLGNRIEKETSVFIRLASFTTPDL